MGCGFDDWVYWHFFTITINYYSAILTAEASVHSASLYTTDSASLKAQISTLLELTNPLHRSAHRRHHVQQFLCFPVGCQGNLVFSTRYVVTTISMLYVITGI
jgi:hypothetical protein